MASILRKRTRRADLLKKRAFPLAGVVVGMIAVVNVASVAAMFDIPASVAH